MVVYVINRAHVRDAIEMPAEVTLSNVSERIPQPSLDDYRKAA